MPERFTAFLEAWKLVPDGAVMLTHSSRLLPVRRGQMRMILKTAVAEEEKLGVRLLSHWAGAGAVPVVEHSGDTILMLRATGARSLKDIARSGEDEAASEVICCVVSRLHSVQGEPSIKPVPLEDWFGGLRDGPKGGVFDLALPIAGELLADPQDIRVLHGDIHHDNVLDFEALGWLAIDPKGLIGERGYDYANIFCNPDAATALRRGRFEARIEVVSQTAVLDPSRLTKWVLAYSALSASWSIRSGDDPSTALSIGEIAAGALGLRVD